MSCARPLDSNTEKDEATGNGEGETAEKFQISNFKYQISSKHQFSKSRLFILVFGHWVLGFIWDLDIGICDLEPKESIYYKNLTILLDGWGNYEL